MNTQYLSLSELESFDSRSPSRGKERRFLCPVCGQNKPRDAAHRSLAVNTETGGFLCHRCQTKGRLKEYWESRPIMQKNQRTKLKLMSHFALRDVLESESKKQIEKLKTDDLAEKMAKYQSEFLHSPAEMYLLGRGIPTEIAVRAACGYAEKWEHWEKREEKWILLGTDRRVVFPIYDESGEIVAIHGRAIDENHLASAKITRGDKSLGLFLSDAQCLNGKVTAICEGAVDALALSVCGIPAAAMTGTSAPEWFYKKTAFRRVLLAVDNDDAGNKAAFVLRNELASRGTKIFRLRPKNAKDWGEVLEKIGEEAMQKHLSAFREKLSDEDRFSEAAVLFNYGRSEAAEFAAELIENSALRENLLYQIRTSRPLNL